jgi:hypothetical protein
MHTETCYGGIILNPVYRSHVFLHFIGVIIINQRISSPEVILNVVHDVLASHDFVSSVLPSRGSYSYCYGRFVKSNLVSRTLPCDRLARPK